MDYELSGKRILVTGATGFIGAHLAKRLLNSGMHVRAMARNLARANFLVSRGAEVVYGDMTDQDSLKRAVQDCQVVFHFAGAVGEYQPLSYYRAINVEGTRMLASAAIDAHVERFTHTSSIRVFGLDADKNTDENSSRQPGNEHYGITKLEGENIIRSLIRKHGLPAVITYPSVVYGPYDDAWTTISIDLIRKGKMVLFDGGKGLMTPIFIDDLVDGTLAVAQKGKIGEAYILVGPENVTIKDFETSLAHILGKEHLPSLPIWAGLTLATLAEWEAQLFRHEPIITRREVRLTTMHATYSGAKARRELGFEPCINLNKGILRVEEWLTKTGKLSQ